MSVIYSVNAYVHKHEVPLTLSVIFFKYCSALQNGFWYHMDVGLNPYITISSWASQYLFLNNNFFILSKKVNNYLTGLALRVRHQTYRISGT